MMPPGVKIAWIVVTSIAVSSAVYLTTRKVDQELAADEVQEPLKAAVVSQNQSDDVNRSSHNLHHASPAPRSTRPRVDDAAAESLAVMREAMAFDGTDSERVLALLAEAVRLDPANREAQRRLAGQYLAHGDYSNAFDQARTCLAADSTNTDCYTTIIIASERVPDLGDTQTYVQRCLSDFPNNEFCLSSRVRSQLLDGDLNEALPLVNRLREEEPDAMWTRLEEALQLEVDGDSVAAAEAFSKACAFGHEASCKRISTVATGTRFDP